jgi:hypothetical protein
MPRCDAANLKVDVDLVHREADRHRRQPQNSELSSCRSYLDLWTNVLSKHQETSDHTSLASSDVTEHLYSFLIHFSLTMVFTRLALRSARPTPLLRQCTTPIKHQHGAVFARAAFPNGVRSLTATSSQQGKVLLVLYDVSISLHLSKLS